MNEHIFKNNLILVRGLPGSGKTSFALNFLMNGIVFSTDDFFMQEDGEYNFDASKLGKAHKWNEERVERAMKNKIRSDIVVANTLTTEKEISVYTDMAEKYGYNVFSIIVENRHGKENIHGVSEETMKKMRERFVIKL